MKHLVKKVLLAIVVLSLCYSANAQYGRALSKVKKGVSASKRSEKETTSTSEQQETQEEPNASQTPVAQEVQATPKHIDDQGITNATHQKYVEQIVWSNEKITKDAPDETRFKNKFKAGEYIFGRYYLSESLQNFVNKKKNEEVQHVRTYSDVYIDGNLQNIEFEPTELMSTDITATTRQIWVCKQITADAGDGGTKRWVDLVNKKMTPGEHTVRFDLRIQDCPGVLATGSFTYVKGNEKLKYGWSFANYSQGMKDAALEAEILKFMQKYATNSGWSEKFTKVKIYSDDWNSLRNEITGAILGRTIGAYCLATWPDGHCTVQPFIFKQDYNGSSYSKALSMFKILSQDEVDCE